MKRDTDLLMRLYFTTQGQEPTRITRETGKYAGRRDEFVFCERICDHGHADDCVWQQIADRIEEVTAPGYVPPLEIDTKGSLMTPMPNASAAAPSVPTGFRVDRPRKEPAVTAPAEEV